MGIRLRLLVEGQSELIFAREHFADWLAPVGIWVHPQMVEGRGGDLKFPRVVDAIVRILKQDSGVVCSTLFDYYGLPSDWDDSAERPSVAEADDASALERRLIDAVESRLPHALDVRRFEPYLQLHEFESLLFASPPMIAGVLADPELNPLCEAITNTCGGPEAINNSRDTAPSRRLRRLASHYDKTLHGPRILGRIGLDGIRARCPRFHGWVARLEGRSRVAHLG